MQQVLFNIPIFKDWFPPNGIPIHGFGVMLFITFVLGVWYLGWRAATWKANLPRKHVQDLVIALFVSGLLGARLTFMIQYHVPFSQIFKIWEGGIVLYGGIISGVAAYMLIYLFLLRKVGVNFWRLGDAIAPGLALGIALGRIGCFLNGCCYGHVACDDCPQVGFPLMTAPAREIVVDRQCYQTPTGFTVKRGGDEDFRSIVDKVEPRSAADRAGLKPGDRLVTVNRMSNGGVILIFGTPEVLEKCRGILVEKQAVLVDSDESKDKRIKAIIDNYRTARELNDLLSKLVGFAGTVFLSDRYTELINNWPRGEQSLQFEVMRGGRTEVVPDFIPRTIGLHPTQLYETISMLFLVAFLTFFYPFRRRDGQVFVVFLVCYAVHRFLNEMLRNDTDIVAFGMTISQNISVLMVFFAGILSLAQKYTSPLLGSQPPT